MDTTKDRFLAKFGYLKDKPIDRGYALRSGDWTDLLSFIEEEKARVLEEVLVRNGELRVKLGENCFHSLGMYNAGNDIQGRQLRGCHVCDGIEAHRRAIVRIITSLRDSV